MFEDHAAHLYDYCLSMLGDEHEAAGAARVTLIAAYKLGGRMTEPGRLRAWMFALGRRECLSGSPTRNEPWAVADRSGPAPDGSVPGAVADAETSEFARIEPGSPTRTGFEAEIRRVVRLAPRAPRPSRPDEYHEVLDLVERHGIAPAELPAILDMAAEEAQNLLAAAPVMTSRRDQPRPLASMPAALWRDTASVVFEDPSLCDAIAADAGRLWADGFPADPVEVMPPSPKRMAATSVGLAAALLAPAALGAGLYAAFAASPHSVTRSHVSAIAPPQGTQHSPSGSGSTAAKGGNRGRTHQKVRQSVTSIFPTAPSSAPIVVTTPKPKQTTPPTHGTTSSPPVIKSSPPSPSPTSPSPTSPSPTSPSPTSPSPTSPAPTSPSQSLPTNVGTSPSPSG